MITSTGATFCEVSDFQYCTGIGATKHTPQPQKASDQRVVFSSGVLRSKAFFDPILVVFSDFCSNICCHP